MKPFPPIAALFLTLGSVISFLLGGGIFVIGIFTSLKIISLFFLVFLGSLLVFQGGIYWGFTFFEPQILIMEEGLKKDKHYLVNGTIIFIWGMFSLLIGVMTHPIEGYFCEALGFIGVLMMDRHYQCRSFLPAGYYRIKIIVTFLVLLGILGASLGSLPPLL